MSVGEKKSLQKEGFRAGENIVYPSHGVGQVREIETQTIAGATIEFFVIDFIKEKMTLRVPTSKFRNAGMRKLSEESVFEKAMNTLGGRARVKRTMWSRRAQEYETKINSGNLITIAEVVRDLYRLDSQPEQSYSERQLYEAALDRVAREVAAIRQVSEEEAVKLVKSYLAKNIKRTKTSEDEGRNNQEEAA
ncbi:MAG: CarD family transcriptional regulator [Alphaproteobacteria bacterium]|nr:CarD family transcriptional regulator [Alphaproteobacteria bacterium]